MAINTLPPGLQHWREWLDWFSEDLALSIGSMLISLQPLIGQHHAYTPQQQKELSGLDTIRTRGRYDRLLLSEWLLADAHPDEFIRRASSGEHLFLSPSEHSSTGTRKIIVLFDSGPSQFGAAKLVHIALWILLCRRAQQLNAEFSWGFIQSAGELHNNASDTALQTLLHGRQLKPIDETQWQAWHRHLTQESAAGREIWSISNSTFDSITWLTQRITIQRLIGRTALKVSNVNALSAKTADLLLPSVELGTRLLQGRFTQRINAKSHIKTTLQASLQRAPLFSYDGHHIAVAQLDSSALVFRVPDSVTHKPKPPVRHTWSTAAYFVAGALHGKKFGGVLISNTHLSFWQIQRFGSLQRREQDAWKITPGTANWLPCFVLSTNNKTSVYLLDSKKSLCIWHHDDMTKTRMSNGEQVIANILAIAQLDHRTLISLVKKETNRFVVELLGSDLNHPEQLAFNTQSDPTHIVFGGGSAWRQQRGCLAYTVTSEQEKHDDLQRWKVLLGNRHGRFDEYELVFKSGFSVIGVYKTDRGIHSEAALLAVAPNRRDVVMMSSHTQEVLCSAPSPISKITANAGSRHIAFITEERVLFVYSVAPVALLLTTHSETQHD